jgi:hypothetical protein
VKQQWLFAEYWGKKMIGSHICRAKLALIIQIQTKMSSETINDLKIKND